MYEYQRALITGASSGIGRAFALQLPSATKLLLTGRDTRRLAEVAGQAARPGREVQTLAADLAYSHDRDRLIAQAETIGIDLLINNAGTGYLAPFLDIAADEERRTVMVNVLAVVDLTRRLLPGMLQRARANRRRCGLIIVSSTAAFAPVPMFATYAASKVFDLHFAEALAEELRGEPIDILALCPGATRTGFGGRAGRGGAGMPGAADPRDVARQGLAALGREIVCVPGRLTQAALKPVILPRRLMTGALGMAMRFIAGQNR